MSITQIRESGQAKGTGKRWNAKLISADVWGSTAYYPAEVLARDAATAFPVGTKMYENHMTESELYERPVGDVSKLVGKLVSPGEFIADHEEGPGVYADVEFYDSYVDRIREIGDDIGLSVDGAADYVEGERDQRYGKIVTGIPFIKSVDVVTAAGAGGKLITIKESAGPMAGTPVNNEGDQSMTAITKEDLTEAFKSFGESLTTSIKEALTPVAVESAVETAAPVVEAPAAEVATETVAVEEPKAEVEVDLVAIATEFAAAGLPAEVMSSVVTAVQAGSTVADAISAQTTIREAYIAQATGNTVRVVESDRQGADTSTVSLAERVRANLTK